MGFFAGLALIFAIWFSAYFINVLLHELGHAIPVLCWSKQPVAIFIGSYGVEQGSFRCRIGRLTVFITYNPLRWVKGLCQPGERLSVNKQLFYIAMGPATSLFVGVSSWLLMRHANPDGRDFVFLMPMMVIGFLCTLYTAIPSEQVIATGSGKETYNDATLFLRLWRSRNVPAEYWTAFEHTQTEQYGETAVILDGLIDGGSVQVDVLRLAVQTHFKLRNFDRAAVLLEMLRKKRVPTADDLINEGYLKVMTGRYAEASKCFQKALFRGSGNAYALYNYGYSLVVLDKPGEAIPFFERVLEMNSEWAYPYCGRAWARMKLGQWEEGLADARKSLELGDNDDDTYRVLGLYQMEKGQLEEARASFEKARSINAHALFLDESMAELQRREAASGQAD